MKSLIVLCHPERTSFNGYLADSAAEALSPYGEVCMSDLYTEGFDPAEGPSHFATPLNTSRFSALAEQRAAYQNNTLPADVAREIERLEWADFVLLQFPIWWHSAPAMLKGWFDRVFVSGGLYTSSMRYGNGYFRGKTAMCSVTLGAPADVCVPGGRGGDPDAMLWSTQYSLHYMGFAVLPPYICTAVQGEGYRYTDDESFVARLTSLETGLAQRLSSVCEDTPLSFPDWEDWDSDGRPLSG